MRYYLATSALRYAEHQELAAVLEEKGFECTYNWTVHGDLSGWADEDKLELTATEELEAIREADFVVVLLPGRFGTHCEIGAARILGKPMLLHSFSGSHFSNDPETGETKNFYWKKGQIVHSTAPTWEALAEEVADWVHGRRE